MNGIKDTKKQRREIEVLQAHCSATFDAAVESGNHQAEAWARGARTEAHAALLDFDAKDFRYVAGAMEAARGRVTMALNILGAEPDSAAFLAGFDA